MEGSEKKDKKSPEKSPSGIFEGPPEPSPSGRRDSTGSEKSKGYVRKDWEAVTRRKNRVRLKRAVRDAGSCSYGIVAVEVWVLSEDRTRLVRPDGGWWRSPYYEEDEGALERLEREDLGDYVAARSLAPGVGLAGNLWLEEDDGQHHRQFHEQNAPELNWRSLQPIADDPDQAPDPRLPVFLQAGLGQAAGVPFNVRGFRGIVIYFTRTKTRVSAISSANNTAFLRSAADHIGAVCAMAEPQRQIVLSRKAKLYKTLRRICLKLEVACAFNASGKLGALKRKESGSTSTRANSSSMRPSITRTSTRRWKSGHQLSNIKRNMANFFAGIKSTLTQKSTMLAKKARAGSVEPPPSLPASETFFVFAGSVLSLLLIQAFTEIIRLYADYTFTIFSPLGALMASQYVLTAAPASQPRNALFGNAIAGTTSLIITYIPDSVLPKVLRASIATSAAVALQARLGVIHPPGIGFAITLASGKHNWVDVPILLGGCLLAVLSGTFLLNLNEKRQYPIYWRFITVPNLLKKHLLHRRQPPASFYQKDDINDSDLDSLASSVIPQTPQDPSVIINTKGDKHHANNHNNNTSNGATTHRQTSNISSNISSSAEAFREEIVEQV